MLEAQWILSPFCFALESAGNSIAARMAMMAITTNSSIKVKALHLKTDRLPSNRFIFYSVMKTIRLPKSGQSAKGTKVAVTKRSIAENLILLY
jgi:hypothetical protein